MEHRSGLKGLEPGSIRKNSENVWTDGHLQFQLIAERSRVVPGAGYRGVEDPGGLFMAPEIGRGVVADEPGTSEQADSTE